MIKIQLCRYLWRHLAKNQEMATTDWVWLSQRFGYEVDEVLDHISWLNSNGFCSPAPRGLQVSDKPFAAISNYFSAVRVHYPSSSRRN